MLQPVVLKQGCKTENTKRPAGLRRRQGLQQRGDGRNVHQGHVADGGVESQWTQSQKLCPGRQIGQSVFDSVGERRRPGLRPSQKGRAEIAGRDLGTQFGQPAADDAVAAGQVKDELAT